MERKRGVRHGGHGVAGVEVEPVIHVQAEGAAADFKAHQVLVKRGVFVQREIRQLEFALRPQRREREHAAPGNLFARIRGAGERVGILVVRVRAEVVQGDVQRTEGAVERRARGQVGVGGRGAADVELFNGQDHRFGGRTPGRRGVGGEFRQQVGKIEGAVGVHLHPDKRPDGADLLKPPGFAKKRGPFQADIHLVPGQERLAVFVLDPQAAHGGGEGKGVEADFLNAHLAVQLLCHLLHGHVADDGRQDQKTEDGVKEQQASRPPGEPPQKRCS